MADPKKKIGATKRGPYPQQAEADAPVPIPEQPATGGLIGGTTQTPVKPTTAYEDLFKLPNAAPAEPVKPKPIGFPVTNKTSVPETPKPPPTVDPASVESAVRAGPKPAEVLSSEPPPPVPVVQQNPVVIGADNKSVGISGKVGNYNEDPGFSLSDLPPAPPSDDPISTGGVVETVGGMVIESNFIDATKIDVLNDPRIGTELQSVIRSFEASKPSGKNSAVANAPTDRGAIIAPVRVIDNFPPLRGYSERIPATLSWWAAMESQPERFRINEKETGTGFTAQYNPTEFEDSVDIEFNEFSPPGASYSHMHFTSTKNYTVEMELYWSIAQDDQLPPAERARHLLWSWCYPNRDVRPGLSRSLGPPVLIATWPNVFTIECYLISLKVRNLRFSGTGAVTRWVASIKLRECRDAWIGAADVAVSKIRGQEYARKTG